MTSWKPRLCSEIPPTALEWLWPGYVARGKLALLDGDQGMAKSLVTLDLIARLSRGGALPDGTSVPRPYTSIVLSAEDDGGDTIRPRAEAAGVDLARLVVPEFGDQLPQFPECMPALAELVVDCAADLIIIDPLVAFVPPKLPMNLDQYARQVLNPLAAMARRTGCAVLMIRHLTKKLRDRAVLRGQGSMGLLAAARTALFVAPLPAAERREVDRGPHAPREESVDCVLAVSKTNLGCWPPSLGFRTVGSPSGAPVIEWTGPVNVTADDLCKGKAPTGLKVRDRAVDWLRRELTGGPRKSADIYAAAAQAGIPDRTLQRAKDWFGVRSHRFVHRKTKQAEWYWYDPDAAWPKDFPWDKPYELEPLPFLDPLR